jgi:hypothetical protein
MDALAGAGGSVTPAGTSDDPGEPAQLREPAPAATPPAGRHDRVTAGSPYN